MALPFELRTPIPTTEPERLRPAARRTAVLRAVLALALVGVARRRGPRRPQHRSPPRAARPLGHDRNARPRPLGERVRGRVRPDDPQAGALGRTHRRRSRSRTPRTSCCRRARRPASCCRCSASSGPRRRARAASCRSTRGRTSAPARGSPGPACRARDAAARGREQRLDRARQRPRDPSRRGRPPQRRRGRAAPGRDRPADRAALPDAGEVRADPQIVGDSSFLRESSAASPVAAPEGRSVRHALPWSFVLVALALVFLLAVNERLLSRLEVRR